MLSLYRPTEAPLDFERHEYVCSDEILPPMAHFSLTETEMSREEIPHIFNQELELLVVGIVIEIRALTGDEPPVQQTIKHLQLLQILDGVFRLEGVSDIILEPREFDTKADRVEAERQAQFGYGGLGSQDEIGGFAFNALSPGNQPQFSEQIPIDPSGVAPRSGRGSLKNILAGLAGFDINNPEAPVGPSKVSNWFYKDPTGTIQGPFSGFDMHEWYKLGYFTGDLLVRREEDSSFEPLAILISRVDDDNPFLSPPRAAHLRTILTPRSARGFLNQGYEQEQDYLFTDQQRLAPFYPEVLNKDALFQEAALYQAQQERQHYLHLLQREQGSQLYGYNQDATHLNYLPLADPACSGDQQSMLKASDSTPDSAAALLERLQLQTQESTELTKLEEAQSITSSSKSKTKSKKKAKKPEATVLEPHLEPTQPPVFWKTTSKPVKPFLQIQKEEEEAEKSQVSENRRYADTLIKQAAHSRGAQASAQAPRKETFKETSKPKPQINPNNPPPPSDKFLNWCKLMLRGIIDIKVDDVIAMLLDFPLDPPPHFKEIVQELFHEQRNKGINLVDGCKFAHEYIIRRKVDCGLLTPDALPNPSLKPLAPSAATNDSFQVVSKKTRKRAN
ncbi:kinesin-like protein [Massospora cicadina]|nr:kinesin-like protein [Massospora cicadina]